MSQLELEIIADASEFDAAPQPLCTFDFNHRLSRQLQNYGVQKQSPLWPKLRKEWQRSEIPPGNPVDTLITFCFTEDAVLPSFLPQLTKSQIDEFIERIKSKVQSLLLKINTSLLKQLFSYLFVRIFQVSQIVMIKPELLMFIFPLFSKFQVVLGNDVLMSQPDPPVMEVSNPEPIPLKFKRAQVFSSVPPPPSYTPKPSPVKPLPILDKPAPSRVTSIVPKSTASSMAIPQIEEDTRIVFVRPTENEPNSTIAKLTRTHRAYDEDPGVEWQPKRRRTAHSEYYNERREFFQSHASHLSQTERKGRILFGDSLCNSPHYSPFTDIISCRGAEFSHLRRHLPVLKDKLKKAEQIIIWCGVNDYSNHSDPTVRENAIKFFDQLLRDHSPAHIIFLQIPMFKLPEHLKQDCIDFHRFLRNAYFPRVSVIRIPSYSDVPHHHLNKAEQKDFAKFLKERLPRLQSASPYALDQEPTVIHLQKYPTRSVELSGGRV